MADTQKIKDLLQQLDDAVKAVQEHPEYQKLDSKMLKSVRDVAKNLRDTQKLPDSRLQLSSDGEEMLTASLSVQIKAMKIILANLNGDAQARSTR